MSSKARGNVMHDFVLPTILFMSIGGMTWAVRGCAGFGAGSGCIFAGVMLSTAWWYIARDPAPVQSRRYASGWIVLAMTIGFGIAGTRGWMQWPHFFHEALYTNNSKGEFIPISRSWGFLWMFLAGVPWAGIPACFIAWTTSSRRTKPWQWLLRLALCLGMAWLLGKYIYDLRRGWFLPLYDEAYDYYQHPELYPDIKKLIRDHGEALMMLGFYLSALLFEIIRRDWKNTLLIVTVGLVNGIGWSLLQCWMWSARAWPGAQFNFWRAWETSAGLSVGLAFGMAYYLVNRPMKKKELDIQAERLKSGRASPLWLIAFIASALVLGWPEFFLVRSIPELHWFFTEWMTRLTPFPQDPSGASELIQVWLSFWPHWLFIIILAAFGVAFFVMGNRKSAGDRVWAVNGPLLEKWGLYTGLILGLGLSIQNGLRGWAIIYL
ncbi:MAG: hypothetical protein KJ052_12075, partial [Candidatus Hydrogenedentes bacterium]|nr:hypothetical protein [Candidatus Hydrogenedentota bacterium]